MQRLYIETMQDVLQHTPTVIVDSDLKGILPLLPVPDAKSNPAVPAAAAPVINPPLPNRNPTR